VAAPFGAGLRGRGVVGARWVSGAHHTRAAPTAHRGGHFLRCQERAATTVLCGESMRYP
jgi:hypothetical protein